MSKLEQLEQLSPSAAIATYRFLTKLKPTSAKTYQLLGETLIRQGQFEQAIAACQQALELDANTSWLHYSLAKAYLANQQFEQAIAACQQALELDANTSWFHYTLGECFLKQEDWNAAIAALNQSIELNPKVSWAYYFLGEALLETEQIDQAVDVYRKAIDLFPDFPFLQPNLDYALYRQNQTPLDLSILLKRPPKLHKHLGKSVSLGVSSELLNFIDQQVDHTSRTLETGAGISTILFAIKQTTHTCIAPDPELIDRIKNFCDRHQLSTANITFQVACSEVILPTLELGELDFVLIDGRHAFPTPFIDWYYTAQHLKVGGITVVDDTKIWTGDVLKEFLNLEEEWQFKGEFPTTSPNAAAFVKVKEGSHEKWWAQQPYLMQHSPKAQAIW